MCTYIDQLRSLIERTDPDIAPADGASLLTTDDSERSNIISLLAEAASDFDTITVAIGTYDAFLAQTGNHFLTDAQPEQLSDFIERADTLTAAHLRRNMLTSANRALALLGEPEADTTLATLELPALHQVSPRKSRIEGSDGTAYVQQQCATNDEVLAVRMSARLGAAKDAHRIAAAVGIATNGAQPHEGPQVTWADRIQDPTKEHAVMRLSGHHRDKPTSPWHCTPREVELDAFATRATEDWHNEVSAAFPVDPQRSMTYGGNRPLTHKAARSTYNGAIQVARIAAGLVDAPGATPGGLSYWAAAHDAVHHGLDAGAATFGTSIDVMLRRILHRAR